MTDDDLAPLVTALQAEIGAKLADLLDIIGGRGPWEWLGPGLLTYPDGDRAEQALHADCEMLERLGLVERERPDASEGVLWMPTEKTPT
jgi:hypothetical protein